MMMWSWSSVVYMLFYFVISKPNKMGIAIHIYLLCLFLCWRLTQNLEYSKQMLFHQATPSAHAKRRPY